MPPPSSRHRVPQGTSASGTGPAIGVSLKRRGVEATADQDPDSVVVERSPPPPSASVPSPSGIAGDSFVVEPTQDFTDYSNASQPIVTPSQASATLSRQRPRFHTVQDLDMALNQAIEGKINVKNAWASKEASDLLEGITHTIEQTLQAHTEDDFSGFAKVATVVEGCSKVWTSRVDSTYKQSNQMVQRLLRNDQKEVKSKDDGSDEEAAEEAETDGDPVLDAARRRRQQAQKQQAKRSASRTLALDASEINLDSKAQTALTQSSINAQFRAITEKFDQSHAQGLLLNNAPLGKAGNLILDVDYTAPTEEKKEFSIRRARQLEREAVATRDDSSDDEEREEEGLDDARRSDRATTTSREEVQCPTVEEDLEIHSTPDDLPTTWGESLLPLLRLSAGAPVPSLGNPSRPSRSSPNEPMEEPQRASRVSELLLLDHHAIDTSALPLPQEDTGGEDDWADSGAGDWEDEEEATASSGPTADVAAAARRLLEGMDEVDEAAEQSGRPLHPNAKGLGVALGEEDPENTWCLLQDVPEGMMAGRPRSELAKLHRAHRFGVEGDSTSSPSSPVMKKAARKGGKSVSFDLPSVVAQLNGLTAQSPAGMSSTASNHSSSTRTQSFTLDFKRTGSFAGSLVDLVTRDAESSALKTSPDLRRNITAQGKELLLAKDAASNILQFIQTRYQMEQAVEHKLVQPPPLDHVPPAHSSGNDSYSSGSHVTSAKLLPRYLPRPPVTINDFFQPFCTPNAQWNVLHKASGGVADTLRLATAGLADGGLSYGDLPTESIPGGAEGLGWVREGDDDEGYGDLDDDGLYTAQDEGEEGEEYARRQAELSLLAQLEASAVAHQQVAGSSGAASPGLSARPSAEGDGVANGPEQWIEALQAAQPTLVQQIDVSKLRQYMWEAIQQITGLSDGSSAAAEPSAAPSHRGEHRAGPEPLHHVAPVSTLLKATAQRLYPHSVTHKRGRESGDEEEEQEEERVVPPAQTLLLASKPLIQPSFTQVVLHLMPHIHEISPSGVLSPAFLFFSLLFIANTHHVVLSNETRTLEDLQIVGVAASVEDSDPAEGRAQQRTRRRAAPAA